MRALLLAGLLLGCATADGAPAPPSVRVMAVAAPGDTLAYTISWAAGARAASYDFTVSVAATNGTWTAVFGSTAAGALPASGNTTALTFAPKLLAVPWDSATFTVTVASRNSAGVSSPATAVWTVRRKPGPPGPPKVDSALTVTGMLVAPSPFTLVLNGKRVACGFATFASGAVGSFTADRAACDSIRTKYLPGLTAATPAQQAHLDSLAATCVTWTTSSPAAIGLAPRAPCASAVVVTGLALTRATGDQLPYRYVNLDEGLAPVLFTNPKTGYTTCLRPGVGYGWAIAENGQRGRALVACNGPRPTVLAAMRP